MELPIVKENKPKIFDPEEVLGPDGPVAQQLDHYEPRQPQILMAQNVRKALKERFHFFCEAGTGTGKSYAFLIPAIEAALAGNKPVVISTNTISLQEQIFRKDIPDLKKYLGLTNLKVVLRKGRGNYLSLRRLQNASNYEWTPQQIPEFEDVEIWGETTKTGSKQDYHSPLSGEIWEQVKSDQYDCLGRKCPRFKECHYMRTKAEAAEADIIICNHSLLALDLGIKARTEGAASILPDFKHLVVDEAHALEDAIRRAETFEWKPGSAASIVKRGTNQKKKGFLDGILELGGIPARAYTDAKEAIKHLKHFVEVNTLFFEKDVEPFIRQGLRGRQKPPAAKRVKPNDLRSQRSESLVQVLGNANIRLKNICSALKRASDDEYASDGVKQLVVLMDNYKNRMVEIESELKRAIFAEKPADQPYPTHVSSVESYSYKGSMHFMLVSTPIFIRQLSQKILFKQVPSITLTSATLTTNKSFQGIIRNLGAFPDKTQTLQLPHVFDYQKQVKMVLTPKMSDDPWNQRDKRDLYFDRVAEGIKKYVDKTQGNALVLCTSNLQMKALYDRLADYFTEQGYYPLRQGGGMTRDQLTHEIKTVPNTVLFGVDSFWTGVDIPGKNLCNVIIPKLPFPPPTPLSEAQKEMYDIWNRGKPRHKQRNYFGDRVIPEVAIKLQQGFGRLIRRTTDKGIVVLMDSRLTTKFYGKSLLGSLPVCDVLTDDSV